MVDDQQGRENQLVLSYELLALLEWLITHEPQALQALIKRALSKGFKKKLRITQAPSPKTIQNIVIDFFVNLEEILNISLHEDIVTQLAQSNLLHSVDQIDSQVCDSTVLARSVEQAAEAIERNPKQNPKELLYKELLRHWHPQNSENPN